jgi:hypothetical protein
MWQNSDLKLSIPPPPKVDEINVRRVSGSRSQPPAVALGISRPSQARTKSVDQRDLWDKDQEQQQQCTCDKGSLHMYLTECYMLEEDSLLCLHSGIYILSWTDIQAKVPKVQRASLQN